MATNYYTKKFNSTTELAEFLNFGAATVKESGTGYIESNTLIAVTQTNFPDWTDINGAGLDLTGRVFISGGAAGQQFDSLGTVNSASNADFTTANIGTVNAPVNYRIYSAVGTFAGTIVGIYQIDNSSILLIWTQASPIHF